MTPRCASIVVVVFAGCSGASDGIVGHWRQLPIDPASEPPEDELNTWTFRDDGTYVLVEDGYETLGTYEVDGDRLLVTRGTTTTDSGFVVTEDRLLMAALFPDGAVDGPVGTWIGTSVRLTDGVEEAAWTDTMVLAADGTGHYESEGFFGFSFEGTWMEVGESLMFHPGTASPQYLYRVGERGIGDPLLERL